MRDSNIPENRSIVLVQQDTALAEQPYDISGSSDVMRLAVQRIEQRKKLQPQDRETLQKEADQSYRKQQQEYTNLMLASHTEVKEFSRDPKTFAQFAVRYIYDNREEVIQRVLNELGGSGIGEFTLEQGAAFVMSKIIYPAIKDKVVFKGADKWDPALVASDSSSYGLFIRNALAVFIKDLGLLYAKAYWREQFERLEPGVIYSYLEIAEDGVSLDRMMSLLTHRIWDYGIMSCNGEITTYNGDTEMSDVFKKLKIGRYPESVVDNAGYYIFEAIKRIDCPNMQYSMNDNVINNDFIISIVQMLSGIRFPEKPSLPQKSEIKDNEANASVSLPSLEKLGAVKSQLQILMIRLGINRKYYEVLPNDGDGKAGKEANNGKGKSVALPAERMFFDEMARTVFGDDKGGSSVFDALKGYGETSSLGLWSETKASLRRKYNSEPIAQEVTELYQMAQFLYNIQTVGKIYMECGESRQKYYGEILMEVGKIYTERLVEMAVNLEVKLRVGDFKTGEIGKTMSGLAGLLDSSQLSSAIEAAIQVETGLKAGEEANSVLTNKGQLASFDQRLAEGNGNK